MRIEAENRSIILPQTQIYTGDGKGKTTAAIGAGIRAAGHGYTICMIQFLKDAPTGELKALSQIPNFTVFRFQKEAKGFFWNMTEAQKKKLTAETDKAFCYAETRIKNKDCDLLILDEILGCLSCGIIEEERLLKLIHAKSCELILTGRNVPENIAAAADYVSEIKAVKHPMTKGMNARKGIEY